MEHERSFHDALGRAATWRIEGEKLALSARRERHCALRVALHEVSASCMRLDEVRSTDCDYGTGTDPKLLGELSWHIERNSE